MFTFLLECNDYFFHVQEASSFFVMFTLKAVPVSDIRPSSAMCRLLVKRETSLEVSCTQVRSSRNI
ncbi:hypothetical protein O3M35_001570 [Rhynocoris fuscipes]|uniref:Uncharacterized protein n=1 Tax=Rhynocoris fuscipes TaxID=488301 RepID=A0AAW1CPF4_9HEMI